MVNRPKNELELMAGHLLDVVKAHAKDTEPTLSLIAEVAWALGVYLRFSLEPKEGSFFVKEDPL